MLLHHAHVIQIREDSYRLKEKRLAGILGQQLPIPQIDDYTLALAAGNDWTIALDDALTVADLFPLKRMGHASSKPLPSRRKRYFV